MQVGVLGGTFDPIHNGHLTIAEEARQRLGLDRVLFVPAADPWLKGEKDVAAAAHRVEMVTLAIADTPGFALSTVDVDRRGPSYTEDTLVDLKQQLSEDAELFFIIGEDALADFPLWRNPDHIARLCRLVLVRRPGSGSVDVESLERHIPGVSARLIALDNTLIDISSTEVRCRIAQRLAVAHLVPPAVEQYIRQHGLYGA